MCKPRAPHFVSGLHLFRIPDFISGRVIVSALYKHARALGKRRECYTCEEEMRTFVSSSLFSGVCFHSRAVSLPLSGISASVMIQLFLRLPQLEHCLQRGIKV